MSYAANKQYNYGSARCISSAKNEQLSKSMFLYHSNFIIENVLSNGGLPSYLCLL